jgi:hypothetical protein
MRFNSYAKRIVYDKFIHLNRFNDPLSLLNKEVSMVEGGGQLYIQQPSIQELNQTLLRELKGEWTGVIYTDFKHRLTYTNVLLPLQTIDYSIMNHHIELIENDINSIESLETLCLYKVKDF